jgi:hypothetical protein
MTAVLPNILANGAPETALAFNGHHGAALVRRAELEIGNNPESSDKNAILAAARMALLNEPLSAGAARMVAFASEKNAAFVLRSAKYANFLTRRDLMNNLLLIDDSAERGDVWETISLYDAALRTDEKAPQILFPIMIKASSDPEIVSGLARILAKNPTWAPFFINDVIANGPSVDSLLDLRTQLAALKAPLGIGNQKQLMDRLARENRYGDSFAIYSAIQSDRGKLNALIRDGDFEAQGDFYPFEWSFASIDGEGTYAQVGPIEAGSNDDALWAIMARGKGGEIARQTLMLKPGRYRLNGIMGVSEAPAKMPQFEIYCPQDPVQQLPSLPSLTEGTARFSLSFTASGKCDGYTLMLRTPDKIEKSGEIWVDRLEILPLSFSAGGAQAIAAKTKAPEAKLAEAKPAEAKPTAPKPASPKSSSPKSSNTNPLRQKPLITKPSGSKSSTAKSSTAKPATVKPATAKALVKKRSSKAEIKKENPIRPKAQPVKVDPLPTPDLAQPD